MGLDGGGFEGLGQFGHGDTGLDAAKTGAAEQQKGGRIVGGRLLESFDVQSLRKSEPRTARRPVDPSVRGRRAFRRRARRHFGEIDGHRGNWPFRPPTICCADSTRSNSLRSLCQRVRADPGRRRFRQNPCADHTHRLVDSNRPAFAGWGDGGDLHQQGRQRDAHAAVAMLPLPVRGMWIGTFHGLCNRFLRAHWKLAACHKVFRFWIQATSCRPSNA
jgi:hypothetical protein